jgi:DNA-binding CsgD family transcriptional regulator/tetratricopeptide (TPR) repeat protein
VLEGLAVLLRNLSRRNPLIVVLDDIHIADASSWELLAYVANNLPDARLLIVATARGPELGRSAGHGVLLALEQRGLVHRINLAELDRPEVGELAEAVLGESPPDLLIRFLCDRSLGNPLFVIGLLEALRDQGADLSAPALLAVPEALADRVAGGLASLGEPELAVLELLAILARRTELAEIAHVVQESPAVLGSSLRELTRARLVREEERGRALTYEIAHPLIQDVIYERIGGARRRVLHRSAARVLLEHGRLGESAAHFARSASPGDTEAINALLTAVKQAEDRGFHREALPILESLVELLPPGDGRWVQALDAMSRQEDFVYRGNAVSAVRAMRSICSVMQGDDDPARLAGAKFRLASFLAWGSGELEEAETVCRESVALYVLAGDTRQTLLAANELALIRGLRGDFASLSRDAAIVARAAEAAGEPFVAMQAAGAWGLGAFGRGAFDEAETAFRRSVDIAREAGTAHRLIVGLGSLAGTLAFEGRVEESLPLLEEARLLDPAFRESLLLAWETCIWWVAGNYRASLASAREDVLWNESRRSRRRAGSAVFAALSAIEASRPAEAHGFLAAARHVWGDEVWAPHSQMARWAEAVVAWRTAGRTETIGDLRRAVDSIFETDAWALAAFAAADLTEAAAEAREAATAAQTAELLQLIAGRIDRPLYQGLAALGGGWAALASGDAEEAAACGDRAAALVARTGCRSFTGRALELRARAQAEFDRPGAAETLEEAAKVFGVCGAVGRRDRALDALRRLGRPGKRRAAAARGPASLTRREREVAELAVAGMSTRDIAAQLGIGDRTVETHLDNVYAKLGVDSRLELVRHASVLNP